MQTRLCKITVWPSASVTLSLEMIKAKEFLAIRRAISLNETIVLFC